MRSNIGLLLLVYFQKRVLNSSIRVCVEREFVLHMNVKIVFYSGKFDTYCSLIKLFFINSSFNRLLYYKKKRKYEIINKNHNKIITNFGASSHWWKNEKLNNILWNSLNTSNSIMRHHLKELCLLHLPFR